MLGKNVNELSRLDIVPIKRESRNHTIIYNNSSGTE